ncbi:MAG TPA: exopolyphosphatase [Acidimicrobiaceae bacterium]|nr:exopolyphosphatase [Acidimicrobiaceae bacterium]
MNSFPPTPSTNSRFAAIDIGSNAIRLLLCRVIKNDGAEPFFKKESLIRMPLRLGDDVFLRGRISESKCDCLIKTLTGFSYLIDAYQPIAYRTCATSAMREAENGLDIANRVRASTGIDLEIISGDEEAAVIVDNHLERKVAPGSACLYIDVGGGSTELTLFGVDGPLSSRSFPIGTIRLLEKLVSDDTWEEMKDWVKDRTKVQTDLVAIGSGGNINKLFNMAGRREDKPLSLDKLQDLHQMIRKLSFGQRIVQLNLRPDRADVIVPASKIYISVMRWGGIAKIFVPQVGLADGIVKRLYREMIPN